MRLQLLKGRPQDQYPRPVTPGHGILVEMGKLVLEFSFWTKWEPEFAYITIWLDRDQLSMNVLWFNFLIEFTEYNKGWRYGKDN